MSKTILFNIVAGSMCVLCLWLVDAVGYDRGYKDGLADSETIELLDRCITFAKEQESHSALLLEEIRTKCRP